MSPRPTHLAPHRSSVAVYPCPFFPCPLSHTQSGKDCQFPGRNSAHSLCCIHNMPPKFKKIKSILFSFSVENQVAQFLGLEVLFWEKKMIKQSSHKQNSLELKCLEILHCWSFHFQLLWQQMHHEGSPNTSVLLLMEFDLTF